MSIDTEPIWKTLASLYMACTINFGRNLPGNITKASSERKVIERKFSSEVINS